LSSQFDPSQNFMAIRGMMCQKLIPIYQGRLDHNKTVFQAQPINSYFIIVMEQQLQVQGSLIMTLLICELPLI